MRFLWAWLVYTWGGLHRYFGNQSSIRSEHEAAVRCFTKAYQIDPSFRRVLLERGVLLWRELDQPEAAMADFNTLLEDDPGFAPALMNRAMVAQNAGRYREALADFEAYLNLPDAETEMYQFEVQRTIALLREMLYQRPSDGGATAP